MSGFIGRQRELDDLREFLDAGHACLLVVKGRPRIGKSSLVEAFGKSLKMYHFTGLVPTSETTAQDQRDDFCQQLGRQMKLPLLNGTDWSDIFYTLSQYTKRGKVVIFFDEISWMGSKDPNFLGKLKSAWDLYFKKNDQLILILCGSVSPWIEKNILSSTAFMGRVSFTLTVDELSLGECNQFWDQAGARISAYEKYNMLMVTGGVPRYLEEINIRQTAENNIRRMCFKKGGLLTTEFDKIFHDLFSGRSNTYKEVVKCLLDGPADLQTICACLKKQPTGFVSGLLDDLVQSGFVTRDYTWRLNIGKRSLLSQFRLSDNYLRFYLKFIEPNLDAINKNVFADKSLYSIPGWLGAMGLQFENLVLHNRSLIYGALSIKPEDITIDNPYFQRKTTRFDGCQVDYMIQTRYNNLFVCEIKYSRREVGPEIIPEMKEKIAKLSLTRGMSAWPVLIHVNGVSEMVEDSGYFSKIIDFSTFLRNS